jgi:hypothetical protein
MYPLGTFWKNFQPNKSNSNPITDNLDFISVPAIANDKENQIILYNPPPGENINLDFLNLNVTIDKHRNLFCYFLEPLLIMPNKNQPKLNPLWYYEFSNEHDGPVFCKDLEIVEKFAVQHQIKIQVFLCEYNTGQLQLSYPNIKINNHDIYIRDEFLSFDIEIKKQISKTFWCGNRRYDYHRQIILSYLVNFPGNYSWLSPEKKQWPLQTSWIDSKTFRKEDYIWKRIKKGSNKLSKMLFFEEEHKKDKLDNLPYLESYNHCFCAVVNETKFAQPISTISEKVLTAMIMKRPFILVAPPKSLEYLKKLNYKTFDKWWDESYDEMTSHRERIITILELLEKISKMDLIEMQKIYDEMGKTLEHNFLIARHFYKDKTIL